MGRKVHTASAHLRVSTTESELQKLSHWFDHQQQTRRTNFYFPNYRNSAVELAVENGQRTYLVVLHAAAVSVSTDWPFSTRQTSVEGGGLLGWMRFPTWLAGDRTGAFVSPLSNALSNYSNKAGVNWQGIGQVHSSLLLVIHSVTTAIRLGLTDRMGGAEWFRQCVLAWLFAIRSNWLLDKHRFSKKTRKIAHILQGDLSSVWISIEQVMVYDIVYVFMGFAVRWLVMSSWVY